MNLPPSGRNRREALLPEKHGFLFWRGIALMIKRDVPK
jgi:hypothetical protein